MLFSYGDQLKQIGYLIFKKQLRNIFFTEDIRYIHPRGWKSTVTDRNPLAIPSESNPDHVRV